MNCVCNAGPILRVALRAFESNCFSKQKKVRVMIVWQIGFICAWVVWLTKTTVTPAQFNSVQTRCIVKGEAQKNPLLGQFSGGFRFSEERLLCKNSTRKPLNLVKSRIFTNAPCKSPFLYNAPSMHTVEQSQVSQYFQRNNGEKSQASRQCVSGETVPCLAALPML